MKTLLCTLTLVAALPGLASAETITKERVGCHTQEVTQRLLQFVAVQDEQSFGQLLRVSLATGECRTWKSGEDVRVESRTSGYACLAPTGTGDRCYWTSLSAIEAPE